MSAPEKEAVPRPIYLIRVLFTIQVWRGYSQRKKTEKLREEEMIFLGMVSGAGPREHRMPHSAHSVCSSGFCNSAQEQKLISMIPPIFKRSLQGTQNSAEMINDTGVAQFVFC